MFPQKNSGGSGGEPPGVLRSAFVDPADSTLPAVDSTLSMGTEVSRRALAKMHEHTTGGAASSGTATGTTKPTKSNVTKRCPVSGKSGKCPVSLGAGTANGTSNGTNNTNKSKSRAADRCPFGFDSSAIQTVTGTKSHLKLFIESLSPSQSAGLTLSKLPDSSSSSPGDPSPSDEARLEPTTTMSMKSACLDALNQLADKGHLSSLYTALRGVLQQCERQVREEKEGEGEETNLTSITNSKVVQLSEQTDSGKPMLAGKDFPGLGANPPEFLEEQPGDSQQQEATHQTLVGPERSSTMFRNRDGVMPPRRTPGGLPPDPPEFWGKKHSF